MSCHFFKLTRFMQNLTLREHPEPHLNPACEATAFGFGGLILSVPITVISRPARLRAKTRALECGERNNPDR